MHFNKTLPYKNLGTAIRTDIDHLHVVMANAYYLHKEEKYKLRLYIGRKVQEGYDDVYNFSLFDDSILISSERDKLKSTVVAYISEMLNPESDKYESFMSIIDQCDLEYDLLNSDMACDFFDRQTKMLAKNKN
ncbi:MAG: hypothetical protein ACLTBR_03370 [Anaerostipes sp.]|uniref:hypothetical protein n=1 Tax=Anaerostipes sp. TaxID=1872530 RepID=UPI0039914DC6